MAEQHETRKLLSRFLLHHKLRTQSRRNAPAAYHEAAADDTEEAGDPAVILFVNQRVNFRKRRAKKGGQEVLAVSVMDVGGCRYLEYFLMQICGLRDIGFTKRL